MLSSITFWIQISYIQAQLGLRLTESEVSFMAKNTKQTSRPVASKASKVLRDGRYSKTSKSVAGSALAQTKPKKQVIGAVTDLKNQPANPQRVYFSICKCEKSHMTSEQMEKK